MDLSLERWRVRVGLGGLTGTEVLPWPGVDQTAGGRGPGHCRVGMEFRVPTGAVLDSVVSSAQHGEVGRLSRPLRPRDGVVEVSAGVPAEGRASAPGKPAGDVAVANGLLEPRR